VPDAAKFLVLVSCRCGAGVVLIGVRPGRQKPGDHTVSSGGPSSALCQRVVSGTRMAVGKQPRQHPHTDLARGRPADDSSPLPGSAHALPRSASARSVVPGQSAGSQLFAPAAAAQQQQSRTSLAERPTQTKRYRVSAADHLNEITLGSDAFPVDRTRRDAGARPFASSKVARKASRGQIARRTILDIRDRHPPPCSKTARIRGPPAPRPRSERAPRAPSPWRAFARGTVAPARAARLRPAFPEQPAASLPSAPRERIRSVLRLSAADSTVRGRALAVLLMSSP
jgi:hypothetical protein